MGSLSVEAAVKSFSLPLLLSLFLRFQVGRVDIGASLGFLSQYPGEDEFLMQPLSCLEVAGDTRVGCLACSLAAVSRAT